MRSVSFLFVLSVDVVRHIENADDFIAASAEVGVGDSGLAENKIGLSDGAAVGVEEAAQSLLFKFLHRYPCRPGAVNNEAAFFHCLMAERTFHVRFLLD